MSYPVSLEDMLQEREWRAGHQQALLQEYNSPLVSFNLNIPGEIKDFPLARMGFNLGFSLLLKAFKENQLPVSHSFYQHKNTGSTGFMVLEGKPLAIKKITKELEENHPLGRVWDMDVLSTKGEKIGGDALGYPPRTCLLCDKNAFECGSQRAHDLQDIHRKTVAILATHPEMHPVYIQATQRLLKGVLYEVSATIKPGLVDRANNGAHTDMDFFTFLDSSLTLPDYFYTMVKAGFEFSGDSPTHLFDSLRAPGLKAEEAMFSATHGINTHKGIIFSMGLVAAAYGRQLALGAGTTPTDLVGYIKSMTQQVVKEDLGNITATNAHSNGEKLFARHGVLGIRGEARDGFPTVINYGLPAYKKALGLGFPTNDALIYTLLHLMAQLDDTNILWRHDFSMLELVKEKAQEILNACGHNTATMKKLVAQLDTEFIEKNLSPGGGADLLAVTVALYHLSHDTADITRTRNP